MSRECHATDAALQTPLGVLPRLQPTPEQRPNDGGTSAVVRGTPQGEVAGLQEVPGLHESHGNGHGEAGDQLGQLRSPSHAGGPGVEQRLWVQHKARGKLTRSQSQFEWEPSGSGRTRTEL